MESRQGEPTILEDPLFLSELVGIKDCVLNGELTMEGLPRYDSNGIVSSLITIATKQLITFILGKIRHNILGIGS